MAYKWKLDANGWAIPGEGTYSRKVYDGLRMGMSSSQIADRYGRSKGSTAVLAHRIRCAWMRRPEWQAPVETKQIL